ncbi:unnamed protein product [Amoebophrya sp. A25]|nr:unnamed protein product [Amoebophrya sp. A25]|eukprot:GSA25T00027416001.1
MALSGAGEEQPPTSVAPEVDVVSVDIEPNNCDLAAPLQIMLRFSHETAIPEARWRIRFTVDTLKKQKIVDFGETETRDYPAAASSSSANEVRWGVENLEMPPKLAKDVLKYDGLLVFSLMQNDSVLLDVNFVTQVSENSDGTMTRTIMSPV